MSKIKWISTNAEKQWESLEVGECSCKEFNLQMTGTRHQSVSGFGGCFNELGWIALQKLDKSVVDEIMDEFFSPDKGFKFNYCRLPIGASDYADEWYSHNENDGDFAMEKFSIERDHKYLLPYIKEALKRNPDIKLFASPWSPPTWMKKPRAYNHGTLVWEKKILDAYALYFMKFIEAYKNEGVKINQVHIQNEPMSDQKFPSCVWTGEQFREFIADYIGPLFEKNGIDTDIWLGTINGPEIDERKYHTGFNQYANLVLNDKNAKKYIKGVSYQWAGKYAVQQTYESWPDVELIQSENECGDGQNTWGYAMYIFDLFRHYFHSGVTGYIYWNMVLESGGVSTWGWRQNSLISIDADTKKVEINPEYYVMKHFSHYVQNGAVRLGLKGLHMGNSIAFENPNGDYVILLSNGFNKEHEVCFECDRGSFKMNLKANSFNTVIIEN